MGLDYYFAEGDKIIKCRKLIKRNYPIIELHNVEGDVRKVLKTVINNKNDDSSNDIVILYELPDTIPNLYGKYADLASIIEECEPIEDTYFVYIDENCEGGYWFEVEDGRVKVYDVNIKYERGKLLLK